MFFTQFGLLFSNMAWFVWVCFLVGIAFLILEVFQPGFGIFGISGIILMVLSVILRAVFPKENDEVAMQIFQFILLDFIIFAILFGLLMLATKKGWLKKTPFYHSGTAVDEKFSDGTKNYDFLVGKQGVTITLLRPSGKAEIDGALYDVESTGFVIEKGVKIIVTAFESGIIKVKTLE